MSVPEPGWYLDPEDEGRLRWWDGLNWSEHRQPNPQFAPEVPLVSSSPSVAVSEYVPMANSYRGPVAIEVRGRTRGERDRQVRRNNSYAYLGCVFALLGFLFNPFAILSVLGIIFSAIGLAKANDLDSVRKVTGRGTAIAGLVIGVFGLASFTWLLAQRLF